LSACQWSFSRSRPVPAPRIAIYTFSSGVCRLPVPWDHPSCQTHGTTSRPQRQAGVMIPAAGRVVKCAVDGEVDRARIRLRWSASRLAVRLASDDELPGGARQSVVHEICVERDHAAPIAGRARDLLTSTNPWTGPARRLRRTRRRFRLAGLPQPRKRDAQGTASGGR